jgi:hypothetical protein
MMVFRPMAIPMIDESASFSGRDEFIRHYDESDDLTYRVRLDHVPTDNSVNSV